MKELATVCPRLAKVIRKVGRYRLQTMAKATPYEALFGSIIYQQLNGRAAATILGRVQERFDGRTPSAEEVLAAEEPTFRAAGVSHNKWLAIRDLALKTTEGVVPSLEAMNKMHDEEIIERLTQIRGIGRWTVQMMLIFRMKRPDVWPVDDFAIRAAYGKIYGLKESPKPRDLEPLGDRFRPYRSVVSWYLWRSLDV